jgi:transcriptional regulator with XRE-family HTH domain
MAGHLVNDIGGNMKIKHKQHIFAERLKAARYIRNITQRQLATLSEIDVQMLSHFETSGRLPSFDTLYRLSVALDVSVDYLMGMAEQPFPLRTEMINDSLSLLSREDCDLILGLIDFLHNRKQKNENN